MKSYKNLLAFQKLCQMVDVADCVLWDTLTARFGVWLLKCIHVVYFEGIYSSSCPSPVAILTFIVRHRGKKHLIIYSGF